MRLGLIGRGAWGQVYAKTLRGMGIEFWQEGRGWKTMAFPFKPDGVIVATPPATHFNIAGYLIERGFPALIEKPICLSSAEARELLDAARLNGSIVFTGHTRLYSPAWREFKAQALAAGVESVYAEYGGPCKLGPLWDKGSHLVAMTLDLGFDPEKAVLETTHDDVPLYFEVNSMAAECRGSMTFRDVPTKPMPLEVLITEFVAAIEAGKPDIRGLELGVKVVEYLEAAAGLDGRKGDPSWQTKAA